MRPGVFNLDRFPAEVWTEEGSFPGADGIGIRAYSRVVALRDLAPENDEKAAYLVKAGTFGTVLMFSTVGEGLAQVEFDWRPDAFVLAFEEPRYLRSASVAISLEGSVG